MLVEFRAQNAALEAKLTKRPTLRPPAAQKMLEEQVRMLISSLAGSGTDGGDASRMHPPRPPRVVPPLALGPTSAPVSPVRPPTSCGAAADSAASSASVDVADLMSTPRDKAVLSYLYADGGSDGLRPSTRANASSAGSAQSTSRLRRRASTAMASTSSAPEMLGPMKEHLNVYSIDKVLTNIRAALREETQSLMDDIEYLQLCLEEAADDHDQVTSAALQPAAPSMAELRDFEASLKLKASDAAAKRALSVLPSKPTLGGTLPLGMPPLAGTPGAGSGAGAAADATGVADVDDDERHFSGDVGYVLSGAAMQRVAPATSMSLSASTQAGGASGGGHAASLSRPKSRAQRLRAEVSEARDVAPGFR